MKVIVTSVFTVLSLLLIGCAQRPERPVTQLLLLAEQAYLEGDRNALEKLIHDPGLLESATAAYYVGAGLINSGGFQNEALRLLKASAALGNADAHFQIAQAYENGWGTATDLLAALDHYRAARVESEPHSNNLMIQTAPSAPFTNLAGERARLEQLANAGDVEAQYRLGNLLDHGDGAPQDVAAAISWYSQAAEQGHELANLNLGYLYCRGIGIKRDTATANRYLTASNRNAICKDKE